MRKEHRMKFGQIRMGTDDDDDDGRTKRKEHEEETEQKGEE